MATLARQLHGSKTHARGNDPNCPVCIRHAFVADSLRRVNAQYLCDIAGPNGSSLGFYALPKGKVIIVQNYPDDHGFEIYRPINDGPKTSDTLDALLNYASQQSS